MKARAIGSYYARVAKLLWQNSRRFGAEQLLGLRIALAILFDQFRIGDFSGKPLLPEIGAIGGPYLILLFLFVSIRQPAGVDGRRQSSPTLSSSRTACRSTAGR